MHADATTSSRDTRAAACAAVEAQVDTGAAAARRRRRWSALAFVVALVLGAHVELLGGPGVRRGTEPASGHAEPLQVRMLAADGAVALRSESESASRGEPAVVPTPPAARRSLALPAVQTLRRREQPVPARPAPAGTAEVAAESIREPTHRPPGAPVAESMTGQIDEPAAESIAGSIDAPAAVSAKPQYVAIAELPATPAAPSDPDAADAPVPTYATHPPPAAVLVYTARQGAFDGQAELRWQPDGPAYALQLAVRLAGREVLSQSSDGEFDAAGLAPRRFTDRRVRRHLLATNFQRDADKITFSGPADELALRPGVQDRLSWLLQLSAVVAAGPARRVAGESVVLRVVGARADPAVWVLRFVGIEAVATPQGPVAAEHFVREPVGAYDTQARIWLDPQRHHVPVRVALRAGRDGDALDLVLDRATIEP